MMHYPLVALLAVAGPQTNPLVEDLERCLMLADDRARLACTDLAARRLIDAERARDIVVVDRQQLRRARRSTFGIDPGTTDPVTGRAEPSERVESLETTIERFAQDGDRRWTITLVEGGRWRTTEPWSGDGQPVAGARATVRRGAVGSYVLKVDSVRAVRVRRID